MIRHLRFAPIVLLVAAACLVAGCGDDDSDGGSQAAQEKPARGYSSSYDASMINACTKAGGYDIRKSPPSDPGQIRMCVGSSSDACSAINKALEAVDANLRCVQDPKFPTNQADACKSAGSGGVKFLEFTGEVLNGVVVQGSYNCARL